MYLHLGQDYIVPLQSVVAVFDMDTATASKRTRLLLCLLYTSPLTATACLYAARPSKAFPVI